MHVVADAVKRVAHARFAVDGGGCAAKSSAHARRGQEAQGQVEGAHSHDCAVVVLVAVVLGTVVVVMVVVDVWVVVEVAVVDVAVVALWSPQPQAYRTRSSVQYAYPKG